MVCFVIKLMHFPSTILTFVQFFFHLLIDSMDSISINFFKNQKNFDKEESGKSGIGWDPSPNVFYPDLPNIYNEKQV
jgi:hypothetical protein